MRDRFLFETPCPASDQRYNCDVASMEGGLSLICLPFAVHLLHLFPRCLTQNAFRLTLILSVLLLGLPLDPTTGY